MNTYDPAQINDGGLNQMRFELGDVDDSDFYLSDEEINASLEGKTFKRAELMLVESLIARFSYETDLRVDKWEAKLSQRLTAWRALRKKLLDDLALEETNPFGLRGRGFRPPIFRFGIHDF